MKNIKDTLIIIIGPVVAVMGRWGLELPVGFSEKLIEIVDLIFILIGGFVAIRYGAPAGMRMHSRSVARKMGIGR